ncbi:MAG TPA: hypothetical protein VMP01_25875 [Pirellulaceae bacterium]|nr:hypothetical protein [Pirellulaceae bacterium]
MGYTLWSDAHYHKRAAYLAAHGRSAFGFDQDIREHRAAAGVHPLMDPARLTKGFRESRDSTAHAASRAVAVMFDVTGSMHTVPRILQKNLCRLFDLLVDKKYLTDPAVLVGGIGDATCDVAPLQVGQFESGNEIEDDLGRLFLEGGGGGQKTESYELALYFLARKTSIDCWEKRKTKGYAFLIGDEMPYGRVKRKEVKYVFGDQLTEDIPIRQIVAEVREKYELFYILPDLTSYYDDPEVLLAWQKLLGQNALRLPDPAAISESIAATIGLAEGSATFGDLADDLLETGASGKVANAVSSALAGVASAAAAAFGWNEREDR